MNKFIIIDRGYLKSHEDFIGNRQKLVNFLKSIKFKKHKNYNKFCPYDLYGVYECKSEQGLSLFILKYGSCIKHILDEWKMFIVDNHYEWNNINSSKVFENRGFIKVFYGAKREIAAIVTDHEKFNIFVKLYHGIVKKYIE